MRLAPGGNQLEPVPLPDRRTRPSPRSGPLVETFTWPAPRGFTLQQGRCSRLLTRADGLKDNSVQSVTIGSGWGALGRLLFTGRHHPRRNRPGSHPLAALTVADGLPSEVVYSHSSTPGPPLDRHRQRRGRARRRPLDTLRHLRRPGLERLQRARVFRRRPDGSFWVGTSAWTARFLPAAPPKTPLPETRITAVLRNDVERWHGLRFFHRIGGDSLRHAGV